MKPKKRPPVKAPVSVVKQFERSTKLVRKGKKATAVKQFKNIIKQYPNSDLVDDAQMELGQLYFSASSYKKAAKYFMAIIDSEYFSPRETEALIYLARCYTRMNDYQRARKYIETAEEAIDLNDALNVSIYQTQLEIYKVTNEKFLFLKTLVKLSKNHPVPTQREIYKNKAIEFVESEIDDEQLENIVDNRAFDYLRIPALLRYGRYLVEQKLYTNAKRYLEDIVQDAPETDYSEQASEIIKQIDARQVVDQKTIGVILPLSGRLKSIGYRALRGIQYGLGIYGNKRSDLKLAVIDSEGNPDIARRAVDRLVSEDHVIAIIGSLLSKTSNAVASKASEYGVPSIALSQKSGITEIGETVYRNALTSEMQVQYLVDIAISKLGLKRFGILYPNDPYGVEFANLFWDEVKNRGGDIRAAQSYASKETDFRGPIKRLVGSYYLEDRMDEYKIRMREWIKENGGKTGRKAPPDDLLPPIVDFEALFIPDIPRAVGQIAPMLAYNDVKDVKLLGTNVWNRSDLVRRGQKFVENSLFLDSFLTEDPKFKNSQFHRGFLATFGYAPGIFEVQSYDSALFLRQALLSGSRSRSDLVDRMNSTKEFYGAVGKILINEKREFVRPMVALTVQGGKIIPLSGVKNP